MSAFQVSDACIKLLAVWSAGLHRSTMPNKKDLKRVNYIAKLLWDANSQSLQERYGEASCGKPPKVSKPDFLKAMKHTPISVIKQANCLDYQSCEYEGWEASDAHAYMQSAISFAARCITGYEQAPWGIDKL